MEIVAESRQRWDAGRRRLAAGACSDGPAAVRPRGGSARLLWRPGSVLAAAAFAIALSALGACGANALDAGRFGWRTKEARGVRPLLVVWLRQPDDTPATELARRKQYYEELLFGRRVHPAYPDALRLLEPTLVGFYREMSGGLFAFRRAGFVGPLTAPVFGKSAAEIGRLAIVTAARDGHVNFKAFDRNHDGRITANELAVLVIANVPNGQAHRYGNGMPIPGQKVTFTGSDAVVGEGAGFATISHELFHGLGGIDLYGPWGQCYDLNRRLTLMAGTGDGGLADSELSVHLDPWHKMLAGWIEPRLIAIGRPGSAQLAAQHIAVSAEPERKRPLLIYDEKRARTEFFLLEYRTPYRLGYDQSVASSGLVIWHIAYGPDGQPAKLASERNNCKGETVQVTAVFVRGAPDWQQGVSRAWTSAHGAIPLRWMDGKDSGMRLAVAPHKPADPTIEVSWTVTAATPTAPRAPHAQVGARP